MCMKKKLALLPVFIALIGTLAVSQDRSAAVQPAKLEPVRNIGLDQSRSGLQTVLPKEWGRLVDVQRLDGNAYMMFLQNDAGEIYLVRLINQANYLYLDTYDQGGVALVIK